MASRPPSALKDKPEVGVAVGLSDHFSVPPSAAQTRSVSPRYLIAHRGDQFAVGAQSKSFYAVLSRGDRSDPTRPGQVPDLQGALAAKDGKPSAVDAQRGFANGLRSREGPR